MGDFTWMLDCGDHTGTSAAEIAWEVGSSGGLGLRGTISVQGELVSLQRQHLRAGDRLHLLFRHSGALRRWSLSLLRTADPNVLIFTERSPGGVAWQLTTSAEQALTHRQLWPAPMEGSLKSIRLGAYSQHGQLFDFRDWAAFCREGKCLLVCSLRAGAEHEPHLLHARFDASRATLASEAVPVARRAIHRSWLLAAGQLEKVLDCTGGDFGYFSGGKHARGPARLIARHGFARRTRLLSCRRLAASAPATAAPALFATPAAIHQALRRCAERPELGHGHPFWRGEFAAARHQTLDTLARFEAALTQEGYLHPLGSPVAIRPLAPALATFHLLEQLREWSAEMRREAAGHIALLADLLMRGDFYPHRWAMGPREVPYTEQSLYRGMLNQNFHTDVYATVGLAGCVLPTYPRAARWRQHARRQFLEQMRCFVWPGGLWEESHTYALHVQQTLLPLVAALRPFGDGPDLGRDAAFVAMCRLYPSLLSPPDARLDGRRAMPPVGDHTQDPRLHGAIWGWMATLLPQHQEEFLWAWRESGSPTGPGTSPSVAAFAPLFLPAESQGGGSYCPADGVRPIPGYGVVARRQAGTRLESLLVVRCGQAWGHYHPDQGSFWWWDSGELICGDSDAGEGELKFAHEGHSLPSYQGIRPVQHLDRDPFTVLEASEMGGDTAIECEVITRKVLGAEGTPVFLPAAERPTLRRSFRWRGDGALLISDEPTHSPGERVQWNLHVFASTWSCTDDGRLLFCLPSGRRLQVQSHAGARWSVRQMKRTFWLSAAYAQQQLQHSLQIV